MEHLIVTLAQMVKLSAEIVLLDLAEIDVTSKIHIFPWHAINKQIYRCAPGYTLSARTGGRDCEPIGRVEPDRIQFVDNPQGLSPSDPYAAQREQYRQRQLQYQQQQQQQQQQQNRRHRRRRYRVTASRRFHRQ